MNKPTTSGTITANSFSAFETNFAAWLASEEAKVKTLASNFVQTAEKVGAEIVEDVGADLEIAFEELAPIAGAAVLNQAAAVATGQEKFGAAVQDVVQTVEASGKSIAVQTAQLAVQQAYTRVQTAATALTASAS